MCIHRGGLTHQLLFDLVYRLAAGFVERKRLGRILAGPYAMELSYERKFEPDILFVTPTAAARLTDDRLIGPADPVIEIASPSTRAYDRGEKREAYRVGGVREYWIIDHASRTVTVDRPAGREVAAATAGVVRSETCHGFWLRAEWLWADPLPTVEQCLAEFVTP
ncbi:MAG: Uma2 family endonuclease [Phycisphaerales bacterium]|nr:Uma2 family endonuclease [Phycisphaerales bacterium]